MKILLVNDFSSPVGGAEVYFTDLARWLRAAGHEVLTVSSDRAIRGGVPSADRRLSHSGHLKGLDSIFQLRNFLGIRSLEREFQPDVIHFNNIAYALSPSVLFGVSAPAVLTLHDYFGVCLRDKRKLSGEICHSSLFKGGCPGGCERLPLIGIESWRRLSFRRGVRSIAALVAPSRYLAEEYRNSGYERVRHIPHPFPEPRKEPKERREFFLFAGRLDEQKGVTDLLPSYRDYLSQGGTLPLRIVGRGSEADALLQLSAELGLEDHVEFLPWVSREELLQLYDSAAALVLPSRWPEVFSLSILEALSRGLPVVAARVGGIPEVIRDGENGCLFRAGSHVEFTKALQRGADSCEALSRGARATAERGPSPEWHVQALEKLYHSIVR